MATAAISSIGGHAIYALHAFTFDLCLNDLANFSALFFFYLNTTDIDMLRRVTTKRQNIRQHLALQDLWFLKEYYI
jgi:hypothetical protein